MGEYADMAIERDFGSYLDACHYEGDDMDFMDGEFTTVVRVEAGSPCSKAGCGGKLVERVNSYTGQRFLGCSNFPKCRNSI